MRKKRKKFVKCEKQFPIAARKKELQDLVNEIENKITENQEAKQELSKEISSNIEKMQIAKKLQITDDGKMPSL